MIIALGSVYSQESSSSGKAMMLACSYDAFSEFDKWEYSNSVEGLRIENGDSSNVILFKSESDSANGSITITGKTNNGSAYVVVTITNGVIRITEYSE